MTFRPRHLLTRPVLLAVLGTDRVSRTLLRPALRLATARAHGRVGRKCGDLLAWLRVRNGDERTTSAPSLLRPTAFVPLAQRPVWTMPGYRELAPPRPVQVRPVEVLGTHELVQPVVRELPAAYVASLEDVCVHGACLAVLAGRSLVQLTHDTDLAKHPENYERHFRVMDTGLALGANPELRVTQAVEEGVLIGGRFAKNYFHWLIEYLPRVLMARDLGLPGPYVTNALPQQARDLLALFGDALYIEDHELVRFGRLAVPYVPSYCPDLPEETHMAVYDGSLLARLRSELLQRLGVEPPPRHRGSIVYTARRGGHGRNVTNDAAIQALVLERGGQVIDTGRMSIREQAQTFAAADVVIGPGGAALANVLFCQPGATLVVLHRNRHVNPSYFRPLTDAVGVRLLSVAGSPPDPQDPNPHALFSVALSDVAQALDRALAAQAA